MLTANTVKMSSNNILGLSDTEIKIALSALKVMLIDGKVQVPRLVPRLMHVEKHAVFRANVLTVSGRERSPCQTDRPRQS